LKYPSLVSAVVLAGGAGRYGEAAAYMQFKKISNSEAAAWCRRSYTRASHPLMLLTRHIRSRQQLQSRLTFGTIVSLAVEWGLMPLFAPPNPNYGISLSKAREKVNFDAATCPCSVVAINQPPSACIHLRVALALRAQLTREPGVLGRVDGQIVDIEHVSCFLLFFIEHVGFVF
jgi:hypothetical protein